MTTERQRQANKLNALRSTGPRGAGGKARSSKNARKHGLSVGVAADPARSNEVAQVASAFAGRDGGGPRLRPEDAHRFAAATLDLEDVRRIRSHLHAWAINQEASAPDHDRLKKSFSLSANLHRYERRAQGRRHRILRDAAKGPK
jgi:hypothetical protein